MLLDFVVMFSHVSCSYRHLIDCSYYHVEIVTNRKFMGWVTPMDHYGKCKAITMIHNLIYLERANNLLQPECMIQSHDVHAMTYNLLPLILKTRHSGIGFSYLT